MTSTGFITEQTPYVAALGEVAALDQQIAQLSAIRARHVSEARQQLLAQTPHDMSPGGPPWSPDRVARVGFVTELAAFTLRTEYKTGVLVTTSVALIDSLPITLAAVQVGTVSWEHAEVIAKHSTGLSGDALVDYDTRLAELATELNPKQLDAKARAQVEIAQPTTAVERAEKAIATRRLYVDPGKDGMAYLTLHAPAPEVHLIVDRATRLAKGLKNDGDPRSMMHLKVDVLSDLMINGETSIPGATRGVRGRVHVMVPAMTILGVGQEPAILRGYGPIDPATAAQLTAEATSWRRVLTDPITGRMLKTDPRDYRPTQQMRDHARLVHPECVFIGCTSPSTHADIDHNADFAQGGATVDENLAPECTPHHRTKHHVGWTVQQNKDDDTLTLTSPAGIAYTHEPTGRMGPAPKVLFDEAAKNMSVDETSVNATCADETCADETCADATTADATTAGKAEETAASTDASDRPF
jgi:hypothetical protein